MDDEPIPSKVGIIETLPLAERAAAYAAVHDELAARLESRDSGA